MTNRCNGMFLFSFTLINTVGTTEYIVYVCREGVAGLDGLRSRLGDSMGNGVRLENVVLGMKGLWVCG